MTLKLALSPPKVIWAESWCAVLEKDGYKSTVVIENDWDGDDEISTEAETDDKSTEYTPDENDTPESADRDEVNTRIFGAAVIAAVIIGLVIAVIISVKRKKRNSQ